MYRRTWLQVDLKAIEENVRYIQSVCQKKIIAVLKADGYGCGDIQGCRAVMKGGAYSVAVSSLDEAVMLRNQGFTGSVLVLGTVCAEDIPVLVEKKIACAAYSASWVQLALKQDVKNLIVHLAVDTGMNRIGFKTVEELTEAFKLLEAHGCYIEGIFTHFYSAEEKDHVLTNAQFEKFENAVKALPHSVPLVHCDNCDATFFHKDTLSNACRVGISLYGVSSYDTTLQHPVSFYTTVMLCKHVPKGETVGYGHTYTTKEDEIILTCPVGYADGLIRENQGRQVYIDGSYGEIVGRVCMDQMMVKLDHEVEIGTPVEIFGPHISLERYSEELHTIPNETLCLISGRVTRKYMYGNEEISEQNDRMIISEARDGNNL